MFGYWRILVRNFCEKHSSIIPVYVYIFFLRAKNTEAQNKNYSLNITPEEEFCKFIHNDAENYFLLLILPAKCDAGNRTWEQGDVQKLNAYNWIKIFECTMMILRCLGISTKSGQM